MATALKLPSAMVVTQDCQIQAMVAMLRQNGTRLFVDTETTGLNPRAGKLVAIQLYQQGMKRPAIIDCRLGLDLRPLQALANLTWVGHNLNFDIKWLWTAGIRPSKLYDTMIADQLLRSDGNGRTLKELVIEQTGVDISKDEREWFYDLDQRPEWHEPFPPEQIEYMANDVLYLPDIFDWQIERLKEAGMMRVMQLEMRTLPALAAMEMNGVKVDAEAWRAVIADKEREAKELEKGLYESELAQAILRARKKRYDEAAGVLGHWQDTRDVLLAEAKSVWELAQKGEDNYTDLAYLTLSPNPGEGWGDYKKRVLAEWKETHPRPPTPDKKLKEVNFSSSSQLLEGLAELGIQLPNTESETLEKAAEREPVLKPLLEFRRAQKFSTTYGESLLERIEADGRIHPEYQQIGAETGRMSCRRPNWQNIPARTADGARLRKCVVADEGNVLLVTDFPNIELRILAELSGDEAMLEMFASGTDMHSFTARRMFGLGEDVDPKTHVLPNGLKARDVAKTINFGVVYGQSAAGFARKFGVDVKTAEGFIEQYFRLYPRVRSYLDSVADSALELGYSSTILGRKRYYNKPTPVGSKATWEQRKEHDRQLAGIRRQARNHPVQGTSADMTKLALSLFYEYLQAQTDGDYSDIKVVAVVHDEVVVECPENDAGWVEIVLAAKMHDASTTFLKRVVVPEIEVHRGKEWTK